MKIQVELDLFTQTNLLGEILREKFFKKGGYELIDENSRLPIRTEYPDGEEYVYHRAIGYIDKTEVIAEWSHDHDTTLSFSSNKWIIYNSDAKKKNWEVL